MPRKTLSRIPKFSDMKLDLGYIKAQTAHLQSPEEVARMVEQMYNGKVNGNLPVEQELPKRKNRKKPLPTVVQ